jgi:hypothetical protein
MAEKNGGDFNIPDGGGGRGGGGEMGGSPAREKDEILF